VIFIVVETWPLEWHAPDLAELEKIAAQHRKDDAKLCITQLPKKMYNEQVVAEVREACEVAQAATE